MFKTHVTLVSTCLDKLYGFSIKEGHTSHKIYIYIYFSSIYGGKTKESENQSTDRSGFRRRNLAFENSHRFIVISTKMGLKYGTNAARLSFCFSSFYLFFVAFASNLLSLGVRTNHLSDSAHNVTT